MLPPALTIFRLRSLTESSLTEPMRVHPVTSEASVVRRTRVIAILSGSSALAEETDTITSSPTHFAVAFTGSFRGPVP